MGGNSGNGDETVDELLEKLAKKGKKVKLLDDNFTGGAHDNNIDNNNLR